MSEVKDPSKAIEFIIEHAGRHAQAKADRVYIENFLRSKKSLLMAQSDAKTVADREAFAYAHPDYVQLVEGLREAVAREEEVKWLMVAAQARVEVYRTQSANDRAQDRTVR